MTTTQTTRCTECHRPLTAKDSIARGRGKVCDLKARRRTAAARLARPFKDADRAATKALTLLADRALVPTRHDGQYLAVATAGDAAYLVGTAARTCTCKAHQHHGRCTHLLAADIAETTTSRRRDYALAA